MKTTIPKNASGYSMGVLCMFNIGPKWTITCGECEGTFRKRIPLIDYPGICCPYCNTINKLLLITTTGDQENN